MRENVWRRAHRSGSKGNCVEVALRTCTTAVRDSKNPAGGQVCISRHTWLTFLAEVKSGSYDS